MYTNSKNLEMLLSGATNSWLAAGTASTTRIGTSKNDIFYAVRGETMIGGLGDDRYFVYENTAKVVEKPGEGIDTIDMRYWGTIVMPDNVENVILTGGGKEGVGATGATGNALNNLIIAGKTGATLDGARGNDVLVGGVGADVFSIRAGNGSDVIYNFQHGWDAVKLSGYGFTNFQQLLSKSSQVGNDTRIQLGASETLTLRDVSLGSLTASDFNFQDFVAAKVPVNKTLDKAGQASNANGWFVINNAWGSGDLTIGKDYTLTSQFNTSDMTSGTTFNWAYPLTTTDTKILAYPAVQFGMNPHNLAGNPSDTAKMFPVQVSDLASLTADYDLSYSGNLGGFNVSFDIWLANSATASGKETITNEIMIWLHKGGFEAFGKPIGTYKNGDFSATIYHKGTYTALVADENWTKGTIDIADVIADLKERGIISDTEYLRSVELGAEVTSGTGSLTINDLQLNAKTHTDDGAIKSFVVDGSGTQVEVISDSPAADISVPAAPLAEKLFDSKGVQIGTVTTESPSADKTVVIKHDLAGNVVSTDVTVVGKETVVQHFDGNYLLTAAEKTVTNANGSVQTVFFDGNWAITGAARVTVSGAETKTQYFDAKWQPSGMDVRVDEGNGSTMVKHFNASWQLVGAERVAVSGGVTTTQTWDSAWNLVSMERLMINADGSKRAEHYDSNAKMTGYDVIKVVDGVEVTEQYDSHGVPQSTAAVAMSTSSIAQVEETAGTEGSDLIYGRGGSDIITGGSGADVFVFDMNLPRTSLLTITDFHAGEDRFALAFSAPGGIGTSGTFEASAFWSGEGVKAAHDADDRVIYDTASGKLYFDPDGTGSAQATLVAHLVNAPQNLTPADFLIL
ncbi:hypothetical protein ABVV53_06645 [Novosphingobium sp. RD2P27]|uniref:Uncharacterized protein n=1 Tax=Novosphingobium kalidii TaxID=3230299 RepID=A0ABV2CZU7_9SPHN